MGLPTRSAIAAVEVVLAALVLAIAVVTFTGVPEPYPAWPTVGPFPANPELLAPALLALAVLAGTVTDGLGVRSIASAALAALTLWLAATSWHALYTPSHGCVFFGGLLTLVAGLALVGAVVVRIAAGELDSSTPSVRRTT